MPAPSTTGKFAPFGADYAAGHGCAWFSLPSSGAPKDPSTAGGWYSVAGLEAVKFSSWRDLPEGVIWWTNLDKSQIWALGAWRTLREGSMFGNEWSGWLSEGQPVEPARIPMLVSSLSETFARTACWLSQWLRNFNGKEWSWSEGSVPELIATHLQALPAPGPVAPASDPDPVFSAAYMERVKQSLSYLGSRSNGTLRRLVLSFPRRPFAAGLLGLRFAQGPWEPVDRSLWPAEGKHAVWIAQSKVPLLLRISSVIPMSDHADMVSLWLGDRGCRFPNASRDPFWLTGEEAMWLSRHAFFSLDGVWRGSGWAVSPPVPGLDLSVPDQGPLVDVAMSQELVASSFWRAVATPVRDPQSRSRSRVSARALWCRAADRQKCFSAALALHRAGFPCSWFGDGQVCILFDPDGPPDVLASVIRAQGLIVPAMLSGSLPSPSVPDAAGLDLWIKRAGSVETRLDVDRLVAPWRGPVPVKPLLQEVVTRLSALPSPSPAWHSEWIRILRDQASRTVTRLTEEVRQGR